MTWLNKKSVVTSELIQTGKAISWENWYSISFKIEWDMIVAGIMRLHIHWTIGQVAQGYTTYDNV